MANGHVILVARPGECGEPNYEHFEYAECPQPNLGDGDSNVMVETLYLSVDPALRCQMNESTGVDYLKPWGIGQTVMGLGGIGRVVEIAPGIEGGCSPPFQKGDLVAGAGGFPWKRIWLADWRTAGLTKITDPYLQSNPVLVLSCLGLIGLTSLLGLQEKARIDPTKGQVCVVSGAAGACGTLAGQIAKLLGCSKVYGICGTDEKCRVLTEELGFDGSICYKTQNVPEKLAQLCPRGVDVYFDNVGGRISEQVIEQMSPHSNVVLCGQIAVYNQTSEYPPPLSPHVVEIVASKNITRERFLVFNYQDKFEQGLALLGKWLAEGKLKTKETIVHGLENTGKAFVDMMNGRNVGKMIVQV